MQALPLILTGISTVMEVAGHIREGREAKNAGWAQDAKLRQDAGQARAAGQRRALLADRDTDLRQSAALARAAAGGGGIPDDVMASIAGEGYYERQVALYESESEARNLEYRGRIARFEGSQAKRASVWSAGTALLKGGSSMASIYGGMKPGANTTSSYGQPGRASGVNPHTGRLIQSGSRSARTGVRGRLATGV
jgi:hypothetical protein